SAIAGCLQAFFGKNFQGSHLPENWSSTGNAIEKKAFLAKDTLFKVDDFVARGTPSEVSRLHRAAERVLRAQGNQSGRDRLTSTTQIRGAYVPRGLILATGEDIPHGHSLQARCAILSIERGATDTGILTDLQASAELGQFSQTMSDFIRWTAEKADEKDIARLLSEAHSECKEQLANNGHTRMRDNLATLLSGLWLLLEFGKEQAILSDQKIQHCKAQAKNAVHKLANLQVIVDKEASEAERFIQLLQSVLVMGRAHVADKFGSMPDHYLALGWKMIGNGEHQRAEGQGAKIGWVFDDCIHLDPKAAVSVIKALSSSNGNYLGSTERSLAKALREANMLAKCDADRNLTKTSVEGRRKYLLCLRLDLVIEQDGPPPKSPILDCSGDDIPF
ncbi:DNA primase, partial [Paracoccaceae bacterium]|nr:DNA primase [Paracoccaceae bacterium]